MNGKIVLRDYQTAAVSAVYEHLRTRDDNPCIVLPTGSGKTPVIAQICRDAVLQWGGRVIVLAHVKELLQQAVDKLQDMAPELWGRVGVYSAGLGQRDTDQSVLVAGIQSVYQRAHELGPRDLIIIDEAHLIPPAGEGMYRQFLADAKVVNPRVRLVGLTATPYRMSTGTICSDDHLLHHVCYAVGVRELIVRGFLCSLKSKAGAVKADTSGLHIRGGEFIASEVEACMQADGLVGEACNEIAQLTTDRRSVLIFAAGVTHAEQVQAAIASATGQECGFVSGSTPDGERAALIDLFKTGALKYLVNVNVLTTGFDAPNVDCVVLLRPTNSPGLYYQMVGRGFRLHQGKTDCLVLDYAGNILRHGPVDMIEARGRVGGTGEAPAKECPECRALIHASYTICPECGHEFPPKGKPQHDGSASDAGVLSGEVVDTEYEVYDTIYSYHTKRAATPADPPTLRVEYMTHDRKYFSEWLCFEHRGYARQKAVKWWQERSDDVVPETVTAAMEMAESGCLARTESITVRTVTGEKFPRIVAYRTGEKPLPLSVPLGDDPQPFDYDDVPF